MLAPGDPAPDFSLPRLDGTDWHLEEEVAQGPLLLTFIETDCPTCRLPVPYLKRSAEALGPNSHRVVTFRGMRVGKRGSCWGTTT